jgi:hypothetical protein
MPVPVVMVAQLLEARRLQAVGFVDDQQLDESLPGRPDVGELEVRAGGFELDQPAEAVLQSAHVLVDQTRCVVDFGRVEDRARVHVDCVTGCIGERGMAQFGL